MHKPALNAFLSNNKAHKSVIKKDKIIFSMLLDINTE